MCECKSASCAIQITMDNVLTLVLNSPIAIGNFVMFRRALEPGRKFQRNRTGFLNALSRTREGVDLFSSGNSGAHLFLLSLQKETRQIAEDTYQLGLNKRRLGRAGYKRKTPPRSRLRFSKLESDARFVPERQECA